MAWSSEDRRAEVGDCLQLRLRWLWGDLCLPPVEHRKVTLVDCSCHWVTSLVGRFLWCPIVWTRFVQHLLAAEPSSIGRHNGYVACWQVREPQEKIACLLPFGILSVIDLVFILWLVHSSTQWYNHPTHSFIFLQTSCSKLFSVN